MQFATHYDTNNSNNSLTDNNYINFGISYVCSLSNKTKLENRQSAITKSKLNRDKSFNKVHYFSNISTEIYPTSQLSLLQATIC